MNTAAFDASGFPTIRSDISRPDPALIERARSISTATLHEAGGRIGAVPPCIKPVAPEFTLCGPAITVHSPGGDNLWLHRAIYLAQPGDVLVVHVSETPDFGYWGEIMSEAAKARQLGGLVIDGGIRDVGALERVGFPVFAQGVCIRGTGKDYGARGWINHPIQLGSLTVQAGDLVVGDSDGVVILPRDAAAGIVDKAVARDSAEADIIARLRAGASTLDIYNF